MTNHVGGNGTLTWGRHVRLGETNAIRAPAATGRGSPFGCHPGSIKDLSRLAHRTTDAPTDNGARSHFSGCSCSAASTSKRSPAARPASLATVRQRTPLPEVVPSAVAGPWDRGKRRRAGEPAEQRQELLIAPASPPAAARRRPNRNRWVAAARRPASRRVARGRRRPRPTARRGPVRVSAGPPSPTSGTRPPPRPTRHPAAPPPSASAAGAAPPPGCPGPGRSPRSTGRPRARPSRPARRPTAPCANRSRRHRT